MRGLRTFGIASSGEYLARMMRVDASVHRIMHAYLVAFMLILVFLVCTWQIDGRSGCESKEVPGVQVDLTNGSSSLTLV